MANNDASSDANLDLKKRARRRLVGASTLALLGVVVLSVTMEHSPGPRLGGQDAPEILIPSQSGRGVLSTRPAPLPSIAANSTTPPVADAGSGAAERQEPASSPVTSASAVVTELKMKQPVGPVEATKVQATPVATAPEKPSAPVLKATPLVDKGTPTRKAEEAKATAALEDKAGEQWVVQLGAYQSAGNVKLLLSKLKEMGVPAYTEKFDSPQGHRTRVRAGPFVSRDAAEKAQGRIRILGVTGPVAPK